LAGEHENEEKGEIEESREKGGGGWVAGWLEKEEKRKRKEREKIMNDCHRLPAVGSGGAS